jgi:hypothetical protein
MVHRDDLIRAIAPLSAAAVDDALDRLVASGLVYTRGAPPRIWYVFKHALVQDVAYDTMLNGRRLQLHARIAEALEGSHPEMVAQQPELLAPHLARAGSTARAVELWTAAGVAPSSAPPTGRRQVSRARAGGVWRARADAGLLRASSTSTANSIWHSTGSAKCTALAPTSQRRSGWRRG